MAKKGKQLDPYDTIFDFIFGAYKSPKQFIQRGRSVMLPPISGGVAAGLAQIAAAPTMYPIQRAMTDINVEMDSITNITVQPLKDMKVRVGPGSLSSLIGNPRGFIAKAWLIILSLLAV